MPEKIAGSEETAESEEISGSEESPSYIRFENVCKTFKNQVVLKDINISIQEGELITLLGSSGCGKTTLLRSLAGLEHIDSGRIFIDGKDVTHLPPGKRGINMIFQQYSLFPTMTVKDNIAFGLKMKKKSKAEIKESVKRALEMVDLSDSGNKYPSQLSGGEKQRIALARAIVTEAKVLLLDEPFSAIDAKLRKALQLQIRELHERLGLTTVFVTHDQEEAMRISDRIYLMNDGKIEQFGNPEELYLHPKTLFAAGFIGHYNILKTDDGSLAFRPESIDLSHQSWPCEEAYLTLDGMISRITPQGNIIRYTVESESISFDVDYLNDDGSHDDGSHGEGSQDNGIPFALGNRVFARIPKSKILRYPT